MVSRGSGRDGVVETRRDKLELFSKTPESAGELYPLIQVELASLIQAELEVRGKTRVLERLY